MPYEPSFSQRSGIKPLKKEIQIDDIDDELKNGLWNALIKYYWSGMSQSDWIHESNNHRDLMMKIWTDFLKVPLDTLNDHWSTTFDEIKDMFFGFAWYEAYDFIEFVENNFDDSFTNKEFRKYCNDVLEREFSGYRFIGNKITSIVSKEEISEIEKALNSPLKSVNEHLERALTLLSDKKHPDPRNSIKESVSAVEAICQKIVGKDSATLGDALNRIRDKKQIELPPPLRDAWNKIYGYTSSKDGIRHALSDEPKLSPEDARLMLISSSAFVNYLVEKSSKAGIKLK